MGELLIGDIPNIDKKKRFLGSDLGVGFHNKCSQSDNKENITFLKLEALY